jgi:integrase
MPEGRITKKAVDGLSCPLGKDRAFLWDDDLAGFGVAVFPTGRKFYVAQYRQHGRTRRATLGEHGRLTPDEARSAAKKLLGAVENGADPIAQRQAERRVRTFAEVADDFLSLHVEKKRKGRTGAEYKALLKSHILPAIGSRRVVDVRRADVARLHAHMAETPYQANRTVAVVSAVWNWAARRDEVDFAKNPAKGIERNREEGRERFLKADELARLGDALTLAEDEGLPYAIDETKAGAKHAPKPENRRVKLDPHAVAALRLLIFTGARLREILDAQWQYVDLERGVMFLPDSKTGKKPVVLSAPAQAVLADLAKLKAEQPRLKANPHIIAGAGEAQPRADLKKPWAAICRTAQLEGVRLHDLRHTFASYGAGAGLGLPIVGKLLGHTQAATTQRYAHLDADPLKRAADAIGAQINSAMNRSKGAEIVPLKARGA